MSSPSKPNVSSIQFITSSIPVESIIPFSRNESLLSRALFSASNRKFSKMNFRIFLKHRLCEVSKEGLIMHEKIRKFIFENFLFDAENSALDNNDSFLEKGIIDSTGILEVINWMEETFGFEVDDMELIPENLDSVNRLADFIKRKAVTTPQ